MWIIVFAVAAAICGIGWLSYWLCTASLVMYMIGKEYTLPTDEEWRACMIEVIKRKIKLES